MELKDYSDMYDGMRMSDEMDERIKSAVFKQQERTDHTMKKFNGKKAAVAAALCGIVLAGGVSAYAASGNFSLLSIFAGENSEVKNNAADLINTEVSQKKAVNKKQTVQSDLVSFDITEAVCDKNNVVIQLESKANDQEKFLLVPPECSPKSTNVSELNIRGVKVDPKMTVAEYAKSLGKKCLSVSADIDCGAKGWSTENYMKSDGTLVYIIHFENVEKQKKLDYVCETEVCPVYKKNYSDDEIIRNTIHFTLTDKSTVTTVKYLPVSREKIKGTDIVVDEVTFDKSSLSMVCNVKYHYTGNETDWTNNSKDEGIVFYLYDKYGKSIEVTHSGYGGKTKFNGNTAVQSESFSLIDLPDTITFEAKNLYEGEGFELKSYGTFDVKLAK